MAIKKRAAPSGAPEWVLTYGDMMSLLLCFFILLAAFADFEQGANSDRVREAILSIQEALGMKTPSGNSLDTKISFNSVLEQVKIAIRDFQDKHRGDAREEGLKGKTFRLRRMRDGMEITIGGPIVFEPFASRLNEEGREAVARIGDVLKGHRNMVEIRGHAAEGPWPTDWTYRDAMRLSHARAESVADELVQRGIDPRALRLVAVGANEPVAKEVYDPAKLADNRRVEIIVRESILDDYAGQTPAALVPATQPVASSGVPGWATSRPATGIN
ncbi:MAG: hypothetical protein AMXMBFR13_22030 [Phycisphaerae bacterium]